VPDRWIPAKWTWLHRACLFVFGRPKQVFFRTQFIEANESVASIAAEHSLGRPQAESSDLAVWILPNAALQHSNGTSTTLGVLQIITAERAQAKAMTGSTTDSYSADLFAGLAKDAVNLSVGLIVTSGGQTNLLATVCAQLPYAQDLFVLDIRHPESTTNRLEFLITADEIDAKGNNLHPPTPPR
jgi:hypothetical protein